MAILRLSDLEPAPTGFGVFARTFSRSREQNLDELPLGMSRNEHLCKGDHRGPYMKAQGTL